MNHPWDDDPYNEELSDQLNQEHQDQLVGAFLWGLALGILTGALLVFLLHLIL